MKKEDVDDTTKEIIESFVAEGRDMLDDAENKLIQLEDNADEEIVNTIFRLFHSLKGSAGFLKFDNVSDVTHEAETLLDLFRKDKAEPNEDVVDLLYRTTDFLRQIINNIDSTFSDEGFEGSAQIIVHDLENSIKNLQNGGGAPAESGEKPKESAAASDSGSETQSGSMDDFAASLAAKFTGTALDSLEKIEQTLIDLEKKPEDKELVSEIFREVHTIKGNAGMLENEQIEALAMAMETRLDEIRLGKKEASKAVVNQLLKDRDDLQDAVTALTDSPERPEKKKSAGEKPDHSVEIKRIGEILMELGAIDQSVLDSALLQQEKTIGEILVDSGKVSQDVVNQAYKLQMEREQKASAGQRKVSHRKDIRVDTGKLDMLLDLVGELITAETLVCNNPDLEDLQLPNFQRAANNLSKITRDLQEITTSIRMIPLEGLFNKMKRLVRDLSHKFNKSIDFTVTGEETEMDRNVIELISDPLVHIIRNSLDHGIEDASTRKDAGKPETGHLQLNACYEGKEIWITVSDDGKGLDREAILDKAEKNGLFSGDRESISDRDVWNFIFMPGFSTAKKVTEVSGRGVGMDVVKKNIEKIGGKIDIGSKAGQGTSMVVKIPLTLAIIEGITVKVTDRFYSIPIVDVREFFQPTPDLINRPRPGEEVIRLREELLPVVRMAEHFNLTDKGRSIEEGIIVVVENDRKRACLLVDEVIGNQQIVIKSLSRYLGTVKGISGASVMGNGDVTLIMDTRTMLEQVLD